MKNIIDISVGVTLGVLMFWLLTGGAARGQTLDETFDNLGQRLHQLQHDLGAASEEARVYEFYQKWFRPKGNFQGIGHRTQSCCNRSDCFPVVEARVDRGKLWIRVQYPNGDVSAEYWVDPAIIESNQEDPRESPDPRSHACIIANTVACFVEGGGA